MMKTKIQTLLIISTLLISIGGQAQCRDQNQAELTSILKSIIEPSLSIVLDRDNSQFSLLGNTLRFTIPAENISKPARDWRYHVNDIRSDDNNLFFDTKRLEYALDVRFEEDGSEIKGICPSCLKRFRDSRAPDVNWKGARILRIYFRPIAFEGSISLDITEVELFGKFEINGAAASFFPRIVGKIENRIKEDIKTQATQMFRTAEMRREISRRTEPLLRVLSLDRISRISMSTDGSNIQFCR